MHDVFSILNYVNDYDLTKESSDITHKIEYSLSNEKDKII